MSQIVTFYSYKGGVGRSMAVANVAVLLARRGKRVLVVDWDLEAPGLERYFTYFKVDPHGRGLMTMFTDRAAGDPGAYEDYLWTISGEDDLTFDFMPSGKDTDPDYAGKLERFGWESFFRNGGGDYVEQLRDRWKTDYDVVLIDSRTGLSDTGGICTIQLPDVVVAMFTANYQSLYGVRDAMRLVQSARQSLAYDRMQLAIVPLASRFGTRAEFQESQDWIVRCADGLSEFFRDWLPAWADPKKVVEGLKIPQVDYFGFGEKLAVVEQGTSDPEGMGYVYEKVAALLADDLRGAEKVLNLDVDHVEPTPKQRTPDYAYDLFVSYPHSTLVAESVKPIVDQLTNWVGELVGRDIRVFADYTEISLGASFPAEIHHALSRSKLLLALVTPRYFQSEFNLQEWGFFETRENRNPDRDSLIVPVLLRGDPHDAPDWFMRRQVVDFSDVELLARDVGSLHLNRRIEALAERISELLARVPPYDPTWAKLPPEKLTPRKDTGDFPAL